MTVDIRNFGVSEDTIDSMTATLKEWSTRASLHPSTEMEADDTNSEPIDDANVKPKKVRCSRADRIKKVKKTVRDYWIRKINGEKVTRQGIERKHKWNESILSKSEAQSFMKKIRKNVEKIAEKRGGFENINANDRAALLRYISDMTQ